MGALGCGGRARGPVLHQLAGAFSRGGAARLRSQRRGARAGARQCVRLLGGACVLLQWCGAVLPALLHVGSNGTAGADQRRRPLFLDMASMVLVYANQKMQSGVGIVNIVCISIWCKCSNQQPAMRNSASCNYCLLGLLYLARPAARAKIPEYILESAPQDDDAVHRGAAHPEPGEGHESTAANTRHNVNIAHWTGVRVTVPVDIINFGISASIQ
ncbi:hypothetical protein SS50377_21593 [Spironucleus salmonicida]|uniref:Uncharacterized protein n=1 Tax=Spironucleus salmonicida TaxID=348837 RepID=A0A9P8S0T2_9EUKA|nr:hypothetical protein SS50377_21593 [Spironucleus salmonicida]